MEKEHFESLYPDNARFDDLEKLCKFIKEGVSAQILSLPGVGRGTIFGMLTNNKKIRIRHFGDLHKNIHFVTVNFSEIRNRSLQDVIKFFFLCLSDSLKERKMPALPDSPRSAQQGREEYKMINDLFRESLKFKDELVLFQAFKEAIDYLTHEKNLKVVFLFDRFEEYIPTVTSEFFTNLRTLRNRAKYKFSVVFSLNRPLEDLLSPAQLADFYEFIAGNSVYLSLKDDVTTEFRVAYIEKITGKKIAPEVFEKIVKESGGVGKLVKLSAEVVLANSIKDTKKIKEFLLGQKLIQGSLVEICRSLLPIEQQALIREKYDDQSALTYLESSGVLKNGRIQIPLFEEHIKWHAREKREEAYKIAYDDNTNTIKIGEDVLSDRLTSSEFRLLNFLLHNQDRIIDREEIINIVWSTVKSTAGITDQAVDQLIFRLRRKIEKDPNNPTHVQTVKGRGVRFIP